MSETTTGERGNAVVKRGDTMAKEKTMIGYKAFDNEFKCRDVQFVVGKTYTHKGKIELCKSGFHFCERPLDVLAYYPPNCSKFAIVEASKISNEKENDSKRVANKIKIVSEISINDLIEKTITYTFDHAIKIGAASATGWSGAASATGGSGAASATGKRGAASATGWRGAASATGKRGAASATGKRGAASATGESGAASATGESGAASATGGSGAASATGESGAASATGWSGAASATGWRGSASATGWRGAASATGNSGAASATGWRGSASATGNSGVASATGESGAASVTGLSGAASATGKNSVACALGLNCKASGAIGCWLVIAERDERTWEILAVKTTIVDGEKIKENTWYKVVNGEFVEQEEN